MASSQGAISFDSVLIIILNATAENIAYIMEHIQYIIVHIPYMYNRATFLSMTRMDADADVTTSCRRR